MLMRCLSDEFYMALWRVTVQLGSTFIDITVKKFPFVIFEFINNIHI